MDKEEYTKNLKLMWLAANAINALPIQEMLNHANMADTIGPFMTPGLYREKATLLREDMTVMRGCKNLQNIMKGIGK